MQLTAEQKLDRVFTYVSRSPKLIGYIGVMMVGRTKIVDDPALCRTAFTNGRDVCYLRSFVDSLTEPELRFVVLHETLHKAFRHLLTWRHLWKENPGKANRACDYIINWLLTHCGDEGVQRPAMALYNEKYTGSMDAGMVFALLPDEPGDMTAGNGGGLDDHLWDEADDMTPEEKRELAEELDNALRNGGVLAGQIGGGMDRAVEDLLKVKTNWRVLLRNFLSSVVRGGGYSSFRRPNRRSLWRNEYLPTLVTEAVENLVIGIDTSGSIGGETLRRFLSEVMAIVQQTGIQRVHLIYWDTQVHGHETYDPAQFENIPKSTKPKGGGGTDPGCVNAYIKQNKMHPTAAIMLTDGYVPSWGGRWEHPMMWAIYQNPNARPTNGSVVYLDAKDIEEN